MVAAWPPVRRHDHASVVHHQRQLRRQWRRRVQLECRQAVARRHHNQREYRQRTVAACTTTARTTLINVTVAANSATTGGGLASSGSFAMLTLNNTIVAAQKAGGDIAGAVVGGSTYNLVGDGSGMTGISDRSQGNQVGSCRAPINPKLAPLGDYGGPTFTMAVLPSSPAIGGGTVVAGGPNTDQRGYTPHVRIDIGAFQSQGNAIVVNIGTDGVGSNISHISLRQAVNLANALDASGGDHVLQPILRDAPDDHPDRRPAGADQPGDHDNHRPGGGPADTKRRQRQPGVRHRWRVGGAIGAHDHRRECRQWRRPAERWRHAVAL